jgi:hypothetical protein
MIVAKIIQSIILIFVLITMLSLVWRFIQENRKHRQRMKKLDQWSKFHEQLMNWSKEIVDVGVRVNFINQCAQKLINDSNDRLSQDLLSDWSVEEEKMKVCKEWGQYIPSLLQEMRDTKLKKKL